MMPTTSSSHNTEPAPLLRVVQITDTHLFGDPAGRLLGVNTQQSFEQVVEQIAGIETPPDLMLATGDISQDASIESYQRFATTVSRLAAPCYWLPGNHDRFDVMRDLTDHRSLSVGKLERGNWLIILLDSTQPGEVSGRLSEAELERLEQALREAQQDSSPTEHVLVCLHHNPLPGRADWMHDIGLNNPDRLIELLSRYSSVRAVLHGHIHQQRDEYAHGLRFICTPSTCIQFKPQAGDFELDGQAPGWRWLDLYEDGAIVSDVQRLENFESSVDFESTGY